jgi:hypothetical protein
MAKTLVAFLLAVAIAVGGALFVDVESDVVKSGIVQVMTRGFSGLSPRAAVEAVARPYAAMICVFVLPLLLERWGQVLLGSRERGTSLARYSLIVALIMAGFWRGA